MYDDLPPEFVDHAKDITKVLAEMELIPVYFSKSRFRSLSDGQQKRCVVTWLSLPEDKRDELMGQFRKTVRPVTVKTVQTEKKDKKRKIGDFSRSLTIHEAVVKDLVSESDEDEDEDEGGEDSGDDTVKEKPPLDIPSDFLSNYKEIVVELTKLKNPNDKDQPYLQQYYAGTNFLFLVRAEQKKILKIWEKLSDAEKSKILGSIAEKKNKGTAKEGEKLKDTTTNTTTTNTNTPSKPSATNASTTTKTATTSADNTTEVVSVEASSSSSSKQTKKKAADVRPSAVFVSSVTKSVSTAPKPAEVVEVDSTEKVARRKLNHNSSSSSTNTLPSSTVTVTAAPTVVPVSTKSSNVSVTQKEVVELTCHEILAIEDSEAEFAMKLLNAHYVPLDIKETALVQLRAIQQRKVERRVRLLKNVLM